ncbi:MAG: hypothetical protein G01um101466_697, partial [Parcubacteria group bacterium Gr01-1014_66]
MLVYNRVAGNKQPAIAHHHEDGH